MIDVSGLHRFLRGEFETEARGGFARARRIPDTHVRHFLDYYHELGTANREALADAVTLRGALGMAQSGGEAQWEVLKRLPAWEQWRHEAVAGVARDPHFYYSVPILRAAVAQAKCDRALGRPASVPDETLEYAQSVRSVKAPELRTRVRAAMTALFGPELQRVSNKSGTYEGTLNGARVEVGLDYGSNYRQLGYQVVVHAADHPGRLVNAGFEMALGIGLGHWDFIVEENVDDCVALLAESVAYIAALPQRLPSGCLYADC